jgi:hypothetical protein
VLEKILIGGIKTKGPARGASQIFGNTPNPPKKKRKKREAAIFRARLGPELNKVLVEEARIRKSQ